MGRQKIWCGIRHCVMDPVKLEGYIHNVYSHFYHISLIVIIDGCIVEHFSGCLYIHLMCHLIFYPINDCIGEVT